jgi:hypothetical protein
MYWVKTCLVISKQNTNVACIAMSRPTSTQENRSNDDQHILRNCVQFQITLEGVNTSEYLDQEFKSKLTSENFSHHPVSKLQFVFQHAASSKLPGFGRHLAVDDLFYTTCYGINMILVRIRTIIT